MLIRQPISRRWRLGLGTGSVLLVILAYVLLAQHRANGRRVEQSQRAADQVERLDRELQKLQPEGNAERLKKLTEDRAEWLTQRDHPDAVDRTVPTLGVLVREGLIKACTPQGFGRKKEVWLWVDSKATLARLITGLLIGIVWTVAIGLLMGCYDAVEAFFLPVLAFLAKIPPTAMLAVFFVLVGTNFKMYVVMIIFGMLPTLAQAISQSVRKDVPEELVYKAYTLGASQLELIWNVTYKQILPRIIDSARLQIGPALVLLVAAEWMVAGEGFGYRLRIYYQKADMTVVYVYCMLLGLGGLAADYGLIWFRRKLCPWFGD